MAVIDGAAVRVLERPGFAEVESFDAPGVDAVAISNNWHRLPHAGRRRATSFRPDRSIGPARPGEPKDIGAAGHPDQVSAPA